MREGEVGGMAGGAMSCEVRLEAVLGLEVRRGDDAEAVGGPGTRGEAGTVLRSGILGELGRLKLSHERCRS